MTEGQLVGMTMLKGFLIVAASDAVWHYVFGRSWWSSRSAMMGV